jgi:hypothetical protein
MIKTEPIDDIPRANVKEEGEASSIFAVPCAPHRQLLKTKKEQIVQKIVRQVLLKEEEKKKEDRKRSAEVMERSAENVELKLGPSTSEDVTVANQAQIRDEGQWSHYFYN